MTDNLNFKPEILINSTSAGIQNQSLELPKDILTKDMCIYDLSYSFDDTPFLNPKVKFSFPRAKKHV